MLIFFKKILLIFIIAIGFFAQASVISTNAGRVGDWVVTTREVYINYIIENILFREVRGKTPEPTIALNQIKSKEFIKETTTTLL